MSMNPFGMPDPRSWTARYMASAASRWSAWSTIR